MKKVIYCPKCDSWFSGESDTNDCPHCKVPAQLVDIDYDEYKAMNDAQRAELKKQYLLEHETEIKQAQEVANTNHMQSLIEQMAADIHFIKTVVLITVVLFLLAQFLLLINLA